MPYMATNLRRWFCRLWLPLFLGIMWHGAEVRAAEPKIAILPITPESKELADVLTFKWSLTGGATLLERNEINKILAENSLIGNASINYVQVGQLLGADGLVIMETFKTGTTNWLAMRLVAVSPGIVLDVKEQTLPMADLEKWGDFMMENYRLALPKLTVSRAAAIPLSILNLRSALDSVAGRELEVNLTRLTASRLSRQKDFFLLERNRLSNLELEKQLQQVDESSFWTGSYLLEGTLDKNGMDPEVLNISAQLVPPKGGARISIELSGPRTNLVYMADRLAQKISEAISAKTMWPAWDAQAEAENYFAEAMWANRWQLQDQAERAIDAAWALGRKNAQTATNRVEIYRLGALSHPQRKWYENFQITEINGSIFLTDRPASHHLSCAIQALSIYRENINLQATLPGFSLVEFSEQGIALLETGSALLEHFRYVARAQRGNESALKDLQSFCREQSQLLESASTNSSLTTKQTKALQEKLYALQFRFSTYWFSEPLPAADYYHKLLTSGHYPDYRLRVLTDPNYRFRFWHYEDQWAYRKAWGDIVDSLCRSDDFRLHCEGLLLRLRDQPARETPDGSIMSGIVFVEDDELQTALQQRVDDLFKLIWDEKKEEYSTKLGVDFIDATEALISSKCTGWTMPLKEVLRKEQEERRFGRFKHYLKTATSHDAGRFSGLEYKWSPHYFEFTQKRSGPLLPLLYAYELRFPNGDYIKNVIAKAETTADLNFAQRLAWLEYVKTFERNSFGNIIARRNYSENEADVLRAALTPFRQRFPASAPEIDRFLAEPRMQTPAAKAATAEKNRLAAEAEKLKKQEERKTFLEQAKRMIRARMPIDTGFVDKLRQSRLTPEEAAEFVKYIKDYTPSAPPSPLAKNLAERLEAATIPFSEIEDYLKNFKPYDTRILAKYILLRDLTPEEKNTIRPLWLEYKKHHGHQNSYIVFDHPLGIF